jgi:hypothetical protein
MREVEKSQKHLESVQGTKPLDLSRLNAGQNGVRRDARLDPTSSIMDKLQLRPTEDLKPAKMRMYSGEGSSGSKYDKKGKKSVENAKILDERYIQNIEKSRADIERQSKELAKITDSKEKAKFKEKLRARIDKLIENIGREIKSNEGYRSRNEIKDTLTKVALIRQSLG